MAMAATTPTVKPAISPIDTWPNASPTIGPMIKPAAIRQPPACCGGRGAAGRSGTSGIAALWHAAPPVPSLAMSRVPLPANGLRCRAAAVGLPLCYEDFLFGRGGFAPASRRCRPAGLRPRTPSRHRRRRRQHVSSRPPTLPQPPRPCLRRPCLHPPCLQPPRRCRCSGSNLMILRQWSAVSNGRHLNRPAIAR